MRVVFYTLVFSSFCTSLFGQSGSSEAEKASIERGKIAYEQYCLACHQADGSGVPHLNPPLIKTQWTMGDKKVLINIILNGLDEEIEVDGDIYHNIMPAMSYLTDQEIADVLTYVRNSFGNKASQVKEDEVKAIRENSK